ncbi:MAG TPA: IPExxxVDY family protein [Bacteroidales bacterium]|nr:IPExxxVDY family protein [Bacteroidales bacterium]
MKSSAKKIRHKLIADNSISEHFLGIVSAEPDYKVSLLINKHLGIKLSSNEPIVKTINEKEISFPRFSSESEFTDAVYDLISNNSGKEKLLARIPAIDYLMRIKGIQNDETKDKIIRKIRSIREITGVFTLDKNKQIENSILLIIP